MPVHLTAAQAAAMDIDRAAGKAVVAGAPKPAGGTRQRRNRKVARGPYRSTCHDCGQPFTTQAGETRHVETYARLGDGHCRYDIDVAAARGG